MDGQYNRLVWCINTRTIPRCIGETKMASNNENGIGHLRALVPWLIMMMMMRSHGVPASGSHDFKSGCFRIWTPYSLFLAKGLPPLQSYCHSLCCIVIPYAALLFFVLHCHSLCCIVISCAALSFFVLHCHSLCCIVI